MWIILKEHMCNALTVHHCERMLEVYVSCGLGEVSVGGRFRTLLSLYPLGHPHLLLQSKHTNTYVRTHICTHNHMQAFLQNCNINVMVFRCYTFLLCFLRSLGWNTEKGQ